jgi:hypothetical protein
VLQSEKNSQQRTTSEELARRARVRVKRRVMAKNMFVRVSFMVKLGIDENYKSTGLRSWKARVMRGGVVGVSKVEVKKL